LNRPSDLALPHLSRASTSAYRPALKLSLPFTPAHPAAVLPLRKLLVFSALVVGSLAPDFHYFFNLGPSRTFTHSIRGAFIFCLPVSLAVLWIFQTLMKAPLISLSPRAHQEKLAHLAAPFRWRPMGHFAVIVFSVLVGIGTHIVWDSITHERGLIVRNFPNLSAPAVDEFGTPRPLYDVLQHVSTLVGMAILALWYLRWWRRAPIQPVPRYLQMNPRAKAAIVATIVVLGAGFSTPLAYITSYNLYHRLFFFTGTTAILFMSFTATAALFYSLWWQWAHRRMG
jgi:hypothetical protein